MAKITELVVRVGVEESMVGTFQDILMTFHINSRVVRDPATGLYEIVSYDTTLFGRHPIAGLLLDAFAAGYEQGGDSALASMTAVPL